MTEGELVDGLRVGPFRLLAPLAAPVPALGANGVWRAQRESDGQPVVIKWSAVVGSDPAEDGTVDAGRDDRDHDNRNHESQSHPGTEPDRLDLDRFRREIRLLTLLDHPGIVRLLGSGEHGGRLWLALEAIDGPDLSAFTAPGHQLRPADAVRHIAEVADALDHAHRRGVLHRDVKPANIVLDRRAGRARVIDFGISTETDDERTRTGILPGSPAYLAPQQLAGAAPDVAADVYALGITLYELLAGTRPWQAHSLGALLRTLAQDPPTPLSIHVPTLPAEWVDIVHRGLARDPAQRPRRAADLARALRASG